MTYYQTTPLTSDELSSAIVTAKRQDDAVLAVFRRLRNSKLTPSDVCTMLVKYDDSREWVKTSIRRAMSTLTKHSLLVKTDTLRDGPHGRPEHCWRLWCAP